MQDVKYKCIKCGQSNLISYSTVWKCNNCKSSYSTFQGMPKLYFEDSLGANDKSVRSHFYNGTLGKFYQFLMPFLHLPVRPLSITKKDWLAYFITIALIFICIYNSVLLVLNFKNLSAGVDLDIKIICIAVLVVFGIFLITNPTFFYLILFAVPVKISLNIRRFKPEINFQEIHKKYQDKFLKIKDKNLEILDISTGTGNAMYRHWWKKVDAEYTGLDLSQVMLSQCQTTLQKNNVAIDLIIGDAALLPFSDNYFDVVTNYGAVNAYTNIKKALEEMIRVVKKDGLVFFLDEQLYTNASLIEKLYFEKVLSDHCTVRHCPTEFLPENAKDIKVYQVYEFYYICTFSKN